MEEHSVTGGKGLEIEGKRKQRERRVYREGFLSIEKKGKCVWKKGLR